MNPTTTGGWGERRRGERRRREGEGARRDAGSGEGTHLGHQFGENVQQAALLRPREGPGVRKQEAQRGPLEPQGG